MASNTTPLNNATSNDKADWSAALSFLMRNYAIQNLDGCLPAIVTNYDRKNNVATIKPLIMWVDVQDNNHSRNELANINVISIGAGGFHISFPVNQGDLGWILATDRDTERFKEYLNEQAPNTGRIHTFESGLFIPDVFRKYTINAEDSEAMVIQSTDGATRISIRDDNIKITANAVVVDAPTTTFTGDVLMNKTLSVATDAIVGGVSVIGHGHTSSSPGSRTVGGMIS